MTISINQTSITVDAREAGAGKTIGTIYPLIKQNLLNHKPTLIVVPGIELQNEYQRALSKQGIYLSVVNTETKESSSVTASIIDALEQNELVCITQAGFMLLDHSKTRSLFNKFALVMDETINPFKSFELSNIVKETDTGPIADFKWNELFEFSSQMTDVSDLDRYVDVKINKFANTSNMINQVLLNELTSTNWIYSINAKSIDQLTAEQAERVLVFARLNLTVLTYFTSVHIASANFEHEHFGQYLRANSYKYSVVPGCEFGFHRTTSSTLRMHYPVISEINPRLGTSIQKALNLTGNLKSQNSEITKLIINEYAKVIPSSLTNTIEHIVLKNSTDKVKLGYQAQEVKHNCHGENKHRNKTAGFLFSAIRPNTNFATYIREQLKLDSVDQVYLSWASAMFYQVIMRLKLRDINFNGVITVLIADGLVAESLIKNYFKFMMTEAVQFEVQTIDVEANLSMTKNAIRLRDRAAGNVKPKKTPMTPAERMRRSREKKAEAAAQAQHDLISKL